MIHYCKKPFLVAILFTVIMLGSHHASANTITVTTNDGSGNSDGLCSLLEAVSNANNDSQMSPDCVAGSGLDTIVFSEPMTIMPSGVIFVDSPIIFDGTANGNGTCSTKNLGVVIDSGSNASNMAFNFFSGSDGGSVRGLVVNNYDLYGINIADGVSDITISCSMIGLSSDGLSYNAGPTATGIWAYGNTLGISNLTIGGLGLGDGNIIAGGTSENSLGIYLEDTTNTIIQGNSIGLDRDGLHGLDGAGGIYLRGGSAITIGGPEAGARNIISGFNAQNISNAIIMSNDIDGVTIEGNYIGTDITGNVAVPNSRGVSDCGAHCGGTGLNTNIVIKNNVISGNTEYGISIESMFAGTNLVQGNAIGVGADGTTVLGNGEIGITIPGAYEVHNVLIGGSNPENRNIIVGNSQSGIAIFATGLSDNIKIQGNYIGVLADGTTAAPNDTGININEGAGNVQVGGLGVGEGNLIAYSNASGIQMQFPSSGNMILGNTIKHSSTKGIVIATREGTEFETVNIPIIRNTFLNNQEGAIDLVLWTSNDGYSHVETSPNDYLDTDTGPNNFINHPVLVSGTQNGVNIDITYMLDVPVQANPYHIEFFSNPSGLDASGFGQGEVYEGYTNQLVTTAGPQLFTTTITNAILADGITATITDCTDSECTTYGGTSEFSNSISTTSGGIDMGTAPGTQTALADNGSYHIIKSGVSLGATVATDNPDAVDISDKDGAVFINSVPTGEAGSVGPTTYSGAEEELNDATFSGAYTGGSPGVVLAAIIATSPDNEDTADYFVASFDFGETIIGPFTITPGVAQSLGDGVFITFANGTGHTPVSEGNIWTAATIPGGGLDVSSTTVRTGSYTPGSTVYMKATGSTAGYVHAWVDMNNDGDFSDEGERVTTTAGLATFTTGSGISFIAPTAVGTYNVRLRYISYLAPLEPTGEALDGEVEDYTFTVANPTTRGPRVIGGRVTNEYLAQHNITLASPSTDTPATCPANQILTQNLKAGARNGNYHPYTKAIVTEVKILQAHMNRLGFKSGPEDGILGPITDGAIKRMQTFLGTKPDGFVGPITRSLINKSCGSGGLQKS